MTTLLAGADKHLKSSACCVENVVFAAMSQKTRQSLLFSRLNGPGTHSMQSSFFATWSVHQKRAALYS